MVSIFSTRIGTITRVSLIIGTVILLAVSVLFAGTQKSETECSDSAYHYYKSNGYARMGCGTSAHYNAKLDACFVHFVCNSSQGKKISEYVQDLNKGKNLAKYINTRPTASSGACIVNGKQCKDYYEFLDLIKPYMED
jgi:hypothetical protein